MNNKLLKKSLDIALLLLFFLELGGMFLPGLAHELLGCGFLLLIILHNATNWPFYQHFFQGANTTKRLLNKVSIGLFAVSLLLLAISGMALSRHLFSWVQLGDLNWRSVHLGAAISALVLLFIHLLFHARRYIRGRKFFVTAGTAFILAVVGIFGLPYLDRWYHQVHVNRSAIVQGEKAAIPGRVLTVYFSRVGNTDFPPDVDAVSGASVMKDKAALIGNAEMIAAMVQDAVGGDMYAITTVKKYPADYGATTREARQEFDEKRPPALVKPLPDLSNYDVIFVVYPLWWHTLPMAVEGFFQDYDLSSKTIVPIVTHGGGGIGDSIDVLRETTHAKIPEQPLDIYSSDIPSARQDIAAYLKKLQLH